jgi:hypothetical protein
VNINSIIEQNGHIIINGSIEVDSNATAINLAPVLQNDLHNNPNMFGSGMGILTSNTGPFYADTPLGGTNTSNSS